MCKRICMWILARDLQGSSKGPKEGVKEPPPVLMISPRRARARARSRVVRQHHAHDWVVISCWNARIYGMLYLGGFWTIKCEKQVRHCSYMMLAHGARASIMSTIGALFLLPCSISENYPAASRTLPVRFGGAPDAPDALLLRPPKPRKNHAVPLRERLSSYPQK